MRRTLAFVTFSLLGSIALGVDCDTNPLATRLTPDMTIAPQPALTMPGLAPNVTSLSVPKGSTAGGTLVTINGANFTAGATVTFGGKLATGVTVSLDGSMITVTTPANLGMPGAVDVVVNNNNGAAPATLTRGFLYFLSTTSFTTPGSNATIMGLGYRGPRSLATLDLTGQGNLSLVTANGNQKNLSILANMTILSTALSFAAPVAIPLGQDATNVISGDMNADGTTDAVVVCGLNNTLSVVIRSDATATPTTITQATGAFNIPRYAAIADFDGDKNLDIVVSNSNQTVSILLGSADGTTYVAATGSPFAMGLDAFDVAVGDFDGDMRPDVVVGNITKGANTIGVILNKAAGFQVQSAITIAGANQPNAVAVADFDGDKKLDVVVANRAGGSVAILKGDAAGGFSLMGALIGVGSAPEEIAAADLDLDGIVDVVVPNFGSNNLHFITNNGDGTFNTPKLVTLAAGSQPNAVAVADFNRDGKPDIAVTGWSTGGVDILLNTGM